MRGDAVDARCGPALQLVKRKAQQVDLYMVQERRRRIDLSRLAAQRMRSIAWDTLAQLWVWCVLLKTALPLAPPLVGRQGKLTP